MSRGWNSVYPQSYKWLLILTISHKLSELTSSYCLIFWAWFSSCDNLVFWEVNDVSYLSEVHQVDRMEYVIQEITFLFVSVIIQVRLVFRKTVGDWCFDYLSGSCLQSQVKCLCQKMDLWLVLVLIGQFCQLPCVAQY